MARPPAYKKGEPTKDFKVAEGFIIGDNNNERKEGGDMINLTHAQAVYFQKLGAIEIVIPEFGNESATNSEEAGNGKEADSGGEPSVGDPSPADPTPKARTLD